MTKTPTISHKMIAALLFCSFTGHTGSVWARNQCRDIFSPDPALLFGHSEAQNAWGPSHFSKPENFDPNHFRLIVHAGPNVTGTDENPIAAFMRGVPTMNVNQPQLFSASVVSAAHTATFSRTGVILQVPQELIVASTSVDMRSHVKSNSTPEETQKKIEELYDMDGLRSPKEILENADHSSDFFNFGLNWTEVVVKGSSNPSVQTRITGLFTHQDSLGSVLLKDEYAALVKETADKMKLPLVLLPPPKGEFVLKVRVAGNRKRDHWQEWGPQSIQFFSSRAEVAQVFKAAQAAGKNVRLVDETPGPQNILAPPGFFDGFWIEKVVRQSDKRDWLGNILYVTDFVRRSPQELPADVPPYQFSFAD